MVLIPQGHCDVALATNKTGVQSLMQKRSEMLILYIQKVYQTHAFETTYVERLKPRCGFDITEYTAGHRRPPLVSEPEPACICLQTNLEINGGDLDWEESLTVGDSMLTQNENAWSHTCINRSTTNKPTPVHCLCAVWSICVSVPPTLNYPKTIKANLFNSSQFQF